MKKNITRIMLLAISAVLTLSMVFGLAGCAPSGPDAYAKAEASWKAAAVKSVKDDITVSAKIDLGTLVGEEVELAVSLELNRKYKTGGAIDTMTGKINSVKLSGLNKDITNLIPTVLSTLKVQLPEGIDIKTIIGNGTITLDNPASGQIKAENGNYVFTGEAKIDLANLDVSTDDLEEDVTVEIDYVDGIMEDLSLVVPFDLLTLYNFKAANISKDNAVSFSGKEGLNYLLEQAYALVDNLFEGQVEFDGKDIVVDQKIIDIVEGVCGGTDSDSIDAYLFGSKGLIDLGNVNLDITYSDKKFDTIKGTHTMGFEIKRAEIERILNLPDVKTALATIMIGTTPLTPTFVTNILYNMVQVPETLQAEISVTFTSTYTY